MKLTHLANGVFGLGILAIGCLGLASGNGNFALETSTSQQDPQKKIEQQQIVQPRLKLRIVINQGKWELLRYENYTIDPNVVRSMQSKIIEKLQKSGMFEILEREATSDDSAVTEAQVAEARNKQVERRGQAPIAPRQVVIPADFILTPEIVGFNLTSQSGQGLNFDGLLDNLGGLGGIFGGSRSKKQDVKATTELNLRIFAADTRVMLDSASGMGESIQKSVSVDGTIFGVGVSDKKFSESPVGKAMDQAIEQAVKKICDRLSKEHWKASVAAVSKETGRVTINRGSTSGLEVGMEFTVMSVGASTVDDETGVVIPGDEVPVGRVKVVRVESGYAFAEVISGKQIAPKMIVRFIPK